jgi:O-antigen/teichoic acid export membrane protein
VNITANLLLVPRMGMMGAAWATVASYGVMAGLGLWVSLRLFPMPIEWARLARLVAAAGGTYLASLLSPEALLPAIGFKCLVLMGYPALLWVVGFVRPQETAWLREMLLTRRGRPSD